MGVEASGRFFAVTVMQDAFVDSIMSAIHQSQQLLGPFEAKEAAQCWREGAKVFILQLRLTVITIIFGIFNILCSQT